jgi:hypothetical protein
MLRIPALASRSISAQVKNFTLAFSYGLRDPLILDEKEISREEWIRREPKWAVWFSGLYCVSEIAGCLSYVTESKSLADLKDELFNKQQEFISVMNKKLRPGRSDSENAESMSTPAAAEKEALQ